MLKFEIRLLQYIAGIIEAPDNYLNNLLLAEQVVQIGENVLFL